MTREPLIYSAAGLAVLAAARPGETPPVAEHREHQLSGVPRKNHLDPERFAAKVAVLRKEEVDDD